MSKESSSIWRQALIVVAATVGICSPARASTAEPVAPSDLRQFAQRVISHHPEMRAVEADFLAARERRRAADRPIHNPELSLEYLGTAGRERSLGIAQTIDWGDQRGARMQSASAQVAVAEAVRAARVEEFIRILLTALTDYETATSLAALGDRRAAIVRRFAHIADAQRRAGDLDQVSSEFAILAQAEAEMALARTVSELAEVREQLTGLVGGATEWPDLPSMPPVFDPTTAETDVDGLPAVRIAAAELEFASALVSLRRRERQPDPTVGVRAGSEGGATFVGLEFRVPMFVRNDYSAEVSVARAEESSVHARANVIRRQAMTNLNGTAARYRAVLGAWTAWAADGRASMDRQLETLERLWQSGDLNTSEYLLLLRQALDTREAALKLEGEVWRAWFAWLEQSGRGARWIGIELPVRN